MPETATRRQRPPAIRWQAVNAFATVEDFAAGLKERRLERGWTQRRTAAAAGISLSYLKALEAARRKPTRHVALALQACLNDYTLPIPSLYPLGHSPLADVPNPPLPDPPSTPKPPTRVPSNFTDWEPEWTREPVYRPGTMPAEVFRERKIREGQRLEAERRRRAGEHFRPGDVAAGFWRRGA